MTDRELLLARLADEHIECSAAELDELLAGLPAARETVARLWAVDCGDLPPMAPLTDRADDVPPTTGA